MGIEENKKDGFVMLYRSMPNWQWYTNANVMRLFVHCVFKANYIPKKWNGIEIQKGQFVTGRKKLSEELNLTEQEIRTALNKLKSTNEITTKATSKYTIITVNNYCEYQGNNQQSNQQLTNEQPTTNQQLTTTNKENKEKKEKKEKNINSNFSTFPFSNENKKGCVREEQEQQNDNVVYFSDFENTPAEWNTPTTTPKEYQVREFNQEEINVFFTEIEKIFKNDFLPEHIQNGVFHQILEYIIGELEEQKAKGKYTDKDDAETLLRFIRQKKKPEQKQRFIKDFVQQYPEYNPNNEIETVF